MNAQTLMTECSKALDIAIKEISIHDEMTGDQFVEFRRGFTLGFVLGRGTQPRRRTRSMKDWKGFTLDDVAEYIADDEVRWWLHGYADRNAPHSDRAPPEGDEASPAAVRAYRAGLGLTVKGER